MIHRFRALPNAFLIMHDSTLLIQKGITDLRIVETTAEVHIMNALSGIFFMDRWEGRHSVLALISKEKL